MASASPDGIAGVRAAQAKSLKSKKHPRQSWDRGPLFRGMVQQEPAFARSNLW
jgi:hypothetical protein